LANYLKSKDPVLASVYGTAATSYVIERSGGVVVSRMPLMKETERRVTILKGIMS